MRTVDALKPLTAGELLELWRYYRERVEDPLERTLLCNAAILRDSCYCQGEAIYGDELEVLRDLTPGEMEDLLLRLAEGEAAPEERKAVHLTFSGFAAMRRVNRWTIYGSCGAASRQR